MDTTSSSPKRVPLPTTLDIYETNVYNYRRRVQRLPLRRVRLLPMTTIEQLLPLRPNTVDATSSSPDMYDYRCQDREYLYRRREQLLPSTTRTASKMHASKV